MGIDLYADDNESNIRFLAQRVDSLNEQFGLLLDCVEMLKKKVDALEQANDMLICQIVDLRQECRDA